MERVDLPLSELTLAQKLELMEAIWDDLAKHDEALESSDWHEEVLKDREEALAPEGTVSDWNEAKTHSKEEHVVRVTILDAAERDLTPIRQ